VHLSFADGSLLALELGVGFEPARRDVNNSGERLPIRQQDCVCLALDRVAGLPEEDFGFDRLAQQHTGKDCLLFNLAGIGEDLVDFPILFGSQRIERMVNHGLKGNGRADAQKCEDSDRDRTTERHV
jgi:hypothetical protein